MQQPNEIVQSALRSSLERIMDSDGISTVFQLIADIREDTVLGYETLSRGAFPFNEPHLMFDVAERCNLSWDLDSACRISALRSIAALPAVQRECLFFVNVSPRSITDRRAIEGFTLSAMKALGITQQMIVIEVTETTSIGDYEAFENQLRHYSQQGFLVALDDFGSGHSGLLTLVAAAPHFIKLDQGLVSRVDGDPYRQKLISAIVAFASSVGSELIAEGIQRIEEKDVLADLGVRYGQGYLIGEPACLGVDGREDRQEVHAGRGAREADAGLSAGRCKE
ncbi:MAG TPA: EAL domain-containing protein [Spirochaetia bacterium]|nr:EAL domain-containing protein [Spirochaetia bacterium]